MCIRDSSNTSANINIVTPRSEGLLFFSVFLSHKSPKCKRRNFTLTWGRQTLYCPFDFCRSALVHTSWKNEFVPQLDGFPCTLFPHLLDLRTVCKSSPGCSLPCHWHPQSSALQKNQLLPRLEHLRAVNFPHWLVVSISNLSPWHQRYIWRPVSYTHLTLPTNREV